MSDDPAPPESFESLGLAAPLTETLKALGYEAPTPIQAKTIPALIQGRDVIGQAQTGTGKTAAFALPMLQKLDLTGRPRIQALVLAPTRELAIQVAEAVHTYSKKLGRVAVLPIYGGQSIELQLQKLSRGVHVVVGTPGRVMDHMSRGTISLDGLSWFVLDEADEMLRMGFLEDIEWILERAPKERQTALFSATMPAEIRRVASGHLKDPLHIGIETEKLTVAAIEQFYWLVQGATKVDALVRILETEPVEGMLVFARTRANADELAEKLESRGFAAAAMHGDMSQSTREAVIGRLKSGALDLVVATDVAARGLHVDRITHVVNYDMPFDVEAYVHRIGRTGWAGKTGKAILFVAPRERRMLGHIERYTKKRLSPMALPTAADVAARKVARFKERVAEVLDTPGDLELHKALVEELATEKGVDALAVAAALSRLAWGEAPLRREQEEEDKSSADLGQPTSWGEANVVLALDLGHKDGLRPGDIVGALCNQAGVPAKAVGRIEIGDDASFVEVPAEFESRVLQGMDGAHFRGRPVHFAVAPADSLPPRRPPPPHTGRSFRPDDRDGPRRGPPRGYDRDDRGPPRRRTYPGSDRGPPRPYRGDDRGPPGDDRGPPRRRTFRDDGRGPPTRRTFRDDAAAPRRPPRRDAAEGPPPAPAARKEPFPARPDKPERRRTPRPPRKDA